MLDQLIKFIIQEEQALPSEVAKQALSIVIINSYAERQKAAAEAAKSMITYKEYLQ